MTDGQKLALLLAIAAACYGALGWAALCLAERRAGRRRAWRERIRRHVELQEWVHAGWRDDG